MHVSTPTFELLDLLFFCLLFCQLKDVSNALSTLIAWWTL